MNRILSLGLIIAISAGVYWTRISHASESAVDVTVLTQVCKTRSQGKAAVAACERLLAEDGLEDRTRGALLFRQAMAFGYMKDDAAAERAYTQSIALGSYYQRSALHNRAAIYQRAEDWDAMTADIDRLSDEWPKVRDRNYFGGLRMLRGMARDAGDYDRADELALTYLTERPQDLRTLKRRIHHLEKFEDSYPAPDTQLTRLTDLTRIIAEEPGDPNFYKMRAEVLESLGLITPGLKDHLKWLDLSIQQQAMIPDVSEADLAKMEEVQNIVEEEFLEIQQLAHDAANIKANDVDQLRTRAQARFSRGDIRSALADLDAADAMGGAGRTAVTTSLRQYFERVLGVIEGTDMEFQG